MTALQIVLIVLVSLSMLMSLLSVILVFAWRNTTPEIADLRTNLIGLALDQATIVDKFRAYMAREDARHARRGKKKRDKELEEYPEGDHALSPAAPESKVQFRARVFAQRRAANVALDKV